jgi:transposase
VKETDARKLDHKTLEEIRIRAVERVQAGESPEVVTQALGFSRACIYNWLAAYRAGGWNALKAKALLGRPKRITGDQMRWLYETIVGKSPLQFRFEFALWTRQIVQVLLREELKLKLSVSSIGRLLVQLGLTCQRPLFRATEQDPVRVRRWLEQEYPLIETEAKKSGARILFGDESGIRSDYHSGTTWGARGQTPVVRRTVERVSLNMISAIGNRGDMRFMIVDGRVTADVFVGFLQRLMHNASTPIFLILDGHPVHRSRTVTKYVKSLGGVLRLFFLPPYSPELNPDEQVWNYVKNHGVGKRGRYHSSELRIQVQSTLRSLQKLPWKIRMFFLLPSTQYAVG